MSDNRLVEPHDLFLQAGAENDTSGLNPDNMNLEDVEKAVIRKALEMHDGNISKAAEDLGLTRASLYRRLEKHGL